MFCEDCFRGGGLWLVAAKDLERMGRFIENLQQPPEEWTVEMAPSTVKADKLAVLRDLGVTRISMGVVSFHAQRLEALGRMHRPPQIYAAKRIQAAGFPQTNLDLMFALPVRVARNGSRRFVLPLLWGQSIYRRIV